MGDWKEQLSKIQKPKMQAGTSAPPNATLLQEILSKNKDAKELLDALAPLPFFDVAVGGAVSEKFEAEFEKLRKMGVVYSIDDGLYVIGEDGKETADSSVIKKTVEKAGEFLAAAKDETGVYDELKKALEIYNDEAKIREYFSKYENSDENDIWTRGGVDFQLLSYTNSIKNLSSLSLYQAEALYIRATSLQYSRNNVKAFELFKKIADNEHKSYFVAESARRASYIGNKFRYDFAKGAQPRQQECIDLVNKAIQISQASQEPKMLSVRAKSLSMLGNIYIKQYKYRDAETKLKESLAVLKEIKDQRGIAQVLHDLGILFTKRPNRYGDAETKLDESLAIKKEINDIRGITQVLHDLGILFTKQPSRYGDAETKLDESLAVEKEINNQKGIAQVLHDLGILFTKQPNRYGDAETKLDESLAIGKEIKDQKHIAQVANSLGKLFEKLENNEKAVESYRVSLEYNRKLKLHKFVKKIEEKIKKLDGS